MNETIKSPEAPEFSAAFLRWLFSLTIVVLLLVFFIEPRVTGRLHNQNNYLVPAGTVAAGVRVEQGIREFRGVEIEPVDPEKELQTLIYLIVSFVAVPVFTFFLSRKTGTDSAGHTGRSNLMASVRTILFLGCITIASIIIITTVVGSVTLPGIFQTMKEDNTASEMRDRMTQTLVFAYNDVVCHHFTSKKFGGKKKNLTDVTSLAELGIPDSTDHGMLHLQPIRSDTLVTIVMVGTIPIRDNTYHNIDGGTGRPQYALHVSPGILWHSIDRKN
ncbi:MAG: hypothetical protein HYV29_01950 [Ignavibacteriales bacterium]|nr:hypothetical protein [Ignavibacteriales bacterium]